MGNNKSKQRLDVLLRDRNLARSRSKAKRYIMAGKVYVDNQLEDKAGTRVPIDADIEIRGDTNPYVSRGGLKLESALETFDFDCQDKTAIDVGASTGGFTDCILQHGARHVYAVDVGYGQLAWKLRQDERVTVIERTNIRELSPERIPEPCDLAVIDCSFISLELVVPNTLPVLDNGADLIVLLKPQFEAGPERVEQGGVVRDEQTRQSVIAETKTALVDRGVRFIDEVDSRVHGPSGNIEHFLWLQKTPED